jgi:hypothetical protein
VRYVQNCSGNPLLKFDNITEQNAAEAALLSDFCSHFNAGRSVYSFFIGPQLVEIFFKLAERRLYVLAPLVSNTTPDTKGGE